MVGCLKGLQNIERIQRHRRYRPDCLVSADPQAWWTYLARCYGHHLVSSKPNPMLFHINVFSYYGFFSL